MEIMKNAMGRAVSEALKTLLSEKHLYQYVEVNLNYLNSAAQTIQRDWELSSEMSFGIGKPTPKMQVENEKNKILSFHWNPNGVDSDTEIIAGLQSLSGYESPLLQFELPTINTSCDNCDGRPPFNPAFKCSNYFAGEQLGDFYYLGYRCQQCKGQPIRFLVRRENLKLRLAGRYPIETLPIPKFFPKVVSKYYSDALIAHHAGQTLAGLFLLRVFVEQFWRTIPAIKTFVEKQPRATGDEQADIYQNALPQDFKSRFPSLKDVYGKLSEAIHTAKMDDSLFDDSCSRLVEHFDARRLFQIKDA